MPESISFNESIKKLLGQQFTISAEKERITRALLISAYKSKDVEEAISRVAQAASIHALELLSPIGANEEFRAELKKIFFVAAKLWSQAQHSHKMVEASMKLGDFLENWPSNQFDDLNTGVAKDQVPQAPALFDMLPLFPSIFIPEDDSDLFTGFALYPDQNIFKAANVVNKEYIAVRGSSRGAQSRPATGPARRLSVRHDNKDGAWAEMHSPF